MLKWSFIERIFSAFLSQLLGHGRTFLISVPFLWLLFFFFTPFLIILGISFSETALSAPPFTMLFQWGADFVLTIRLNVANYIHILSDSIYVDAFINSLRIASISTIFCLIIGYPIAYAISRTSPISRTLLLMMVMLPFWTSFLIRVYSWIGMLGKHGFVNNFLIKMGIITVPIKLLGRDFSVCLGMIYTYLPFMILPLYASIIKIDESLLEAASDLGCRPFKSFIRVTLPLTLPGIIGGSLLVLTPAVGEFVIPELLGTPNTVMIGRIIWNEFFTNRDWPVATSLAIVLILLLVLPILFFQKLQPKEGNE